MYSKIPPNGTKKRPHEDSTIERPRKSLLVVDVDDGGVGESKVFSTTPPITMKKRPRDDSGIDTPRTNSFGVHVKDNAFEKTKVFKFRVLLPNGTSVELKMTELRSEIPIEEFIGMVKKEYSLLINQKRYLGVERDINWKYQDLCFTDAYTNKIRLKVDFREFMPSVWHLLWLHDGSAELDEFEDMWDLTPDTDLLRELPDDYTCETALADLIDNSLQALWSNGAKDRRFIGVEVQLDKISIFDSGPGMDGANGNIVKWGKMGASLHRAVREKAIGGEPPYLMPFFGMFGYGGPVATMCLGRRAVVSSKTKRSNKVFTLHMEREALVSASSTENCWKTKGGVRDPFEDEKLNSPHGSFTKVEIFDPKSEVKALYIRRLLYKLKDIYFPYIQCDEVSGKTSRPIEFQVNGKDLAELQGGEVATTNLHSCNGPDFIVQLHFSSGPNSSSMAARNQGVSIEANARLKCVYFPIVEGKENIQRILDKLDKGGCGIRESFESFSCVSVRRLGRLLPDTRWALLPFMEPKQRKGEKTHIMKRLCSRVKCFIDTDSGFNPTPHKTDLAHHHPYTKALKNFGNRSPEDEKEVQVEISQDGKKLSLTQLQNLYDEWISYMHVRYDEETDGGLDQPTIIVAPSKIKKLDLTSEVLRVHKKIKRKEICWTAGQNIKVLKGACSGCHKSNVYATLEYIILEGLQGDASGEARLICRPVGLPENKGCRLTVEEGNTTIVINESLVFPIRIIDSEKCAPVDDIEWGKKLESINRKLPAAINLLSHTECQELEIDGGLPISLEAGDDPPVNVVAVIRPKFFCHENGPKRLEQKFIVRENLEMTLEIKHRGAGEWDHVYSVRLPASSHKGLYGLYIFPLRTIWPVFQKPGIFMFSFSLIKVKDIQVDHVMEVRESIGAGRWEVVNHDKNELYTARVGSWFKPLSIACYDRYKRPILFTSVPKLVMKLISKKGQTLAQVRNKKVEITPDKLTMKIKEFFINSRELVFSRPNYEATLHISTLDEALSVAFPCRVIPGTPRRITVHPTELRKQLLPGQIIEELLLEVFDEYDNHVKEGERILLRLDGFSFQDGSGIISGADIEKKVDANSRVDLSDVLKVSRGYGKKVLLSVISKGGVIFELKFQTEKRELRALQKVFKNCEGGSLLENIAFEIIDAEGKVDESFHDEEKHGRSHTLSIKSTSLCIDSVQYRFRHGRCFIPSIPLPEQKGIFEFSAVHSRYPEINFITKVYVEKIQKENLDSVINHEDVGNPVLSAKRVSANELIPRSRSSDILQNQVAASASPRKMSGSASQKVCPEKSQLENHDSAMNHEDVGNPMLSTRRSSENEQTLLDSPSLKVSQVMNENSAKGFVSHVSDSHTSKIPKLEHTNARGGSSDILLSQVTASASPGKMFGSASQKVRPEKSLENHEDVGNLSTRRSSEHEQTLLDSPTLKFSQVMNENSTKGFVSPSNDSSTSKTPQLEHTNARGGSSDTMQSQVTALGSPGKMYGSVSQKELGDDLASSGLEAFGHKRKLESLHKTLLLIEKEISHLQALIGPNRGNLSSMCGEQSTLEQIKGRGQSAAAAICKMLEEELRHQGIVGVVALLGTVESIELSRMLAQYLGEDQMLAIVCKNYAASYSLETNTHLSMNGGYLAFCLEDIRPNSRQPSMDPQEPLPLHYPTLPNGKTPRGFLGYAVNLIRIEPIYLQWRTESGHGLRESLFYRLFDKLQVYKDRDCMMAAQSCIKAGAVSLDGGMMRGNGLISLGHWEPKILFPVMNEGMSSESLRKMRTLEAREMELAKIKQCIDEEDKAWQRSAEKFVICRDKYNRYMSEMGLE
ncbi:hypothetical protein C2S53_000059 [Perilla frutescens var. hirtella]|uniref:Uncharacterized protein n=1 Tax=Perilla frutescens var. hirtella TaxID=608512 RepID=A0AAD4IVJ8_PERFH|nr:hypothetical protein C2S53_000059 [Perilla frutescens var. hirtella]